MAEYIKREDALKIADEYYDHPIGKAIAKSIFCLPAADVRHVVLCRDCQYFENDCGWCGYFDIGMNVNDFCSHGKREES